MSTGRNNVDDDLLTSLLLTSESTGSNDDASRDDCDVTGTCSSDRGFTINACGIANNYITETMLKSPEYGSFSVSV